MSRFVIAAYRPKPGREAELDQLVAGHVFLLRAEGLVTDRPAYVMKSQDGTVIEVFEWKSKEAIAEAHQNADVASLWARFEACCTHVPLSDLDECRALFAEFSPVA
jgi:hypothetical protein